MIRQWIDFGVGETDKVIYCCGYSKVQVPLWLSNFSHWHSKPWPFRVIERSLRVHGSRPNTHEAGLCDASAADLAISAGPATSTSRIALQISFSDASFSAGKLIDTHRWTSPPCEPPAGGTERGLVHSRETSRSPAQTPRMDFSQTSLRLNPETRPVKNPAR